MSDHGMTPPKPGPKTEPSTATANPMGAGHLGESMAQARYAVPGSLPPAALGGDNRGDLGRFAIAGNATPEAVMDHDYGAAGDKPLRNIEGNPSRDEIKGWFRGGSDAITFDGRDNGT